MMAGNLRTGSKMRLLRCLLGLVIGGLGFQGIPNALAEGPKVQAPPEAIEVLKAYFVAEEKEQYEKLYDLFSRRYKDELSKETVSEVTESGEAKTRPVTTPMLYRGLRLKGEARWSNSSIKSAKFVHPNTVKAVVLSTVEAEGEKERVEKKFLLVKEGETWKIDDIRHTPGRKD